ncbi:MAG: ABC transporter substrate binding protein, partial [Pseudolabrys sp.]
LLSYGVNYPRLYFRAAGMIDKIFKGASPGDLPVEQPTKLELLVNLRTAKALGIELPPTVFRPRRRGDRVSVCFRANQIVETLPNDRV